MARTCFSTVDSVIHSVCAIPAFERPSAIRREHLPLAGRQDVERVPRAACGNELLDERGIDDRGALDDPLERVDEVLDVGDTALEQVAAPLAAREQRSRALHLHVRGESDDGGIRKLLADRLGGFEALGRVRGRHANVDDHEVGPKLAHQVDQLGRVPGLTHDLETGTLEQAGETLAHAEPRRPPARPGSRSCSSQRLWGTVT